MSILDDIIVYTGLSAIDVIRIVAQAPARYKEYPIPKRSGGQRIIAQPSRELKVLQRVIMEHWLAELPIHPSAMAYVTGRNIVDNADAHRHGSAILKLDFQNYFPSIRASDWRTYIRNKRPEWDKENDLNIMIKILFWGQKSSRPKCLSIGAPTSPIVSNIIMFELDELFDEQANKFNSVYTRYADDITISSDTVENLLEVEKFIRSTLRATSHPNLKINEKKRGIYTKGQRRLVTGLVLTPNGKISIGRDRKRKISSLIHKFSLNQLGMSDVGYLKGMIGFSIANEPEFVSRMRIKYGDDVLDRILSIQIPPRIER